MPRILPHRHHPRPSRHGRFFGTSRPGPHAIARDDRLIDPEHNLRQRGFWLCYFAALGIATFVCAVGVRALFG